MKEKKNIYMETGDHLINKSAFVFENMSYDSFRNCCRTNRIIKRYWMEKEVEKSEWEIRKLKGGAKICREEKKKEKETSEHIIRK